MSTLRFRAHATNQAFLMLVALAALRENGRNVPRIGQEIDMPYNPTVMFLIAFILGGIVGFLIAHYL